MPTLLLVNDEPNLLYSLKRGLESDDVRVLTAETAEQGIQALQAHGPDVVLLDVRLPDMSGLEAFAEMRRIDPRLPVVLFTAYYVRAASPRSMALRAVPPNAKNRGHQHGSGEPCYGSGLKTCWTT